MPRSTATPNREAPRRSTAGITRERIVAAARSIVEFGSADRLSMRKLATDLGVAPTAIYWHLGGRRAVLNAVLDDMIQALPAIEPVGDSIRARLRGAALELRDLHLDNPAASQLAHALHRDADLSFSAQLALAHEVAAAGLDGDRAADAVRAILYVVGGFLMVEGSFRERPPGSPSTASLWQERDTADLPAALHTAMGREIDASTVFNTTLDLLLSSILDPRLEP